MAERDRAGAPVRPPGSEGGFTLIEVVVASAVMLVALLVAADLLVESGRVLAHSVARERDPWTLLAGELLRNDVRAASVPGMPDASWSSAPLPLSQPGGAVTWRRQGSTVVRVDAGGMARPLLQGVESWAWRELPGDVLEVQVRFRRAAPFLRNLAGGLPHGDEAQLETLHWLVTARGGAAGSRAW